MAFPVAFRRIAGRNSRRPARRSVGSILFRVFRFSGAHYHCDVWRFRQEVRLAEVTLQPGETCEAQLADAKTIRRIHAAGQFLDFEDLERVLDLNCVPPSNFGIE